MNPDTELRELFLANCKKLAALTAALDMPGDEPTEKLVGLAKAMRAESDQLRACVTELTAALQFIADEGGRYRTTEIGDFECTGSWCAEQARAAIAAARKD
jgi:hypothetical protein